MGEDFHPLATQDFAPYINEVSAAKADFIYTGNYGGDNPYYNGSTKPEIKFPWLGRDLVKFSAEEVTIPATPDYNPRCK